MGAESPTSDMKAANARYQGEEWALYHSTEDPEVIAEWFEDEYGEPPKEVNKTGGGYLAGPKPEGWRRANKEIT